MLKVANRIPTADCGDTGLVNNVGEFNRYTFRIWNKDVWPVEYEISDVALEQIQILRHITDLGDWMAVCDSEPISTERFMNLYGVKQNDEPEEGDGDDVDTWQEEEEFLKELCNVSREVMRRTQPLLARPNPFLCRQVISGAHGLRLSKPLCCVRKETVFSQSDLSSAVKLIVSVVVRCVAAGADFIKAFHKGLMCIGNYLRPVCCGRVKRNTDYDSAQLMEYDWPTKYVQWTRIGGVSPRTHQFGR